MTTMRPARLQQYARPIYFTAYVTTLRAQRTGKIVGDKLVGMWKEAAIALIVPR
jgi:hypothetical protein